MRLRKYSEIENTLIERQKEFLSTKGNEELIMLSLAEIMGHLSDAERRKPIEESQTTMGLSALIGTIRDRLE